MSLVNRGVLSIEAVIFLVVLSVTGCANSTSRQSVDNNNRSNSVTVSGNQSVTAQNNTATTGNVTKSATVNQAGSNQPDTNGGKSQNTSTGSTVNTVADNSAAPNNPSPTSAVINASAPPAKNTSAVTRFNPTIAEAMQDLQPKVKGFALMAPTEPEFSPTVPYIGATTSVGTKGTSYSVNLVSTDQKLSVNSPTLATAQYEVAFRMIGSFGGTLYPASENAKNYLYRSPEGSMAPAYISPPKAPSKKVDLGHGIVGTAYGTNASTTVPHMPMVMWHEGDWTLQVWDGPIADDIQEAKKIVSYLDTHLLPETYGVFAENMAGDGYHTSVKWVYGNVLYSCFNYHSGLQAAQMAVSSRTYPSEQVKP